MTQMNLSTPLGFRDVVGEEAVQRERITRCAQDLFARHGFAPIETPTLEVMDVMRASGRIPSSPFRFFDSKGELLAMRPDVTLQVARMCAARLGGESKSVRLRYTQRVFRDAEGDSDAKAREITQIGIECIGDTGAETDAEIVCMLLEALSLSGVKQVCLSMATVSPLRKLLERSGASQVWRDAVLGAYHESDFVEIDRLTDLSRCEGCDVAGIAPAYASAIRSLPRIRGGKSAIEEARSLVRPLGCDVGLDEFSRVYDIVSSRMGEAARETGDADDFGLRGHDMRLLVDFSVMSSFDYYTGIVFEASSPHLGSALGSGGRYDHMIAAFGNDRPAAGFAFCLEQAMAACALEDEASKALDLKGGAFGSGEQGASHASPDAPHRRKLRIAVPKGALHSDAIACLDAAGLDTGPLQGIGRQLVVSADDVEYIIVRPSDAPAFVAYGAADCGICGRDSLLESAAQVVELVDLKFGGCRFVVAEPEGATRQIEERYRRLGSIRVATKYPNITLAHYAKTGVQVDIVKLHGNIELAPLTKMSERIVDITATGTTLRENHLRIVEDVLDSTARFFANPCSFRTDDRVVELARKLARSTEGASFAPIAGRAL